MTNLNQKIIVRTNFKLSLNSPDRRNATSNKDIKYVNGIMDYFSDDKKKALNMLDYFTGKINKKEEINFVLENGEYATKEDLEKRRKYISRQFYNSNLWQIVLSVPKELVDKNITWRNLEIELAQHILPKTLKKMGFENIKNMSYGFSLHMNTKHPHFHIYFMEKKPNVLGKDKKLHYMRKGKIPKKVINYLKMETMLTIEREGRFKPFVLQLNKDIEELKKYFTVGTKNFVLYDKENILLEEKILKLGKLLEERNFSYNRKIKFNSIEDKKIKTLTKEIQNSLFKEKGDLRLSKETFNHSIETINSYFNDISRKNNISKKDIEYSYTQNKEKYLDNFILNVIVNHARYYYKRRLKGEEIVQAIVYHHYRKSNLRSRKDIVLENFQKDFKLKKEIRQSIKNINYEMNKSIKEFKELFEFSYEKIE